MHLERTPGVLGNGPAEQGSSRANSGPTKRAAVKDGEKDTEVD